MKGNEIRLALPSRFCLLILQTHVHRLVKDTVGQHTQIHFLDDQDHTLLFFQVS